MTTPTGKPVAMVHCNNGTSELDAWMRMISDAVSLSGNEVDMGALYERFLRHSLEADADCGGVVLYNYQSGEPVVGLKQGRPMLVRTANAKFSLANLMRAQIYGIMASLAVGMEILVHESVRIDRLTGHGGLFKTPGIAQRYLAAALNASITVMEHASEGGPYGMAILAAYRKNGCSEKLETYLQEKVFANAESVIMAPDITDRLGFVSWMAQFKAALSAEATAATIL